MREKWGALPAGSFSFHPYCGWISRRSPRHCHQGDPENCSCSSPAQRIKRQKAHKQKSRGPMGSLEVRASATKPLWYDADFRFRIFSLPIQSVWSLCCIANLRLATDSASIKLPCTRSTVHYITLHQVAMEIYTILPLYLLVILTCQKFIVFGQVASKRGSRDGSLKKCKWKLVFSPARIYTCWFSSKRSASALAS